MMYALYVVMMLLYLQGGFVMKMMKFIYHWAEKRMRAEHTVNR